jgi:hypothetical protein
MTRSLGAGEAATIRPKRPFCDDGADLICGRQIGIHLIQRKLAVHNSLSNVVLYDQPVLKSDATTSIRKIIAGFLAPLVPLIDLGNARAQ